MGINDTDGRPVLMGFRDATEYPGHKRIQIFAGRNAGARGNSGDLLFREDEWPAVRAALLRGGFEEMPPLAPDPTRRPVDGEPWKCKRCGVCNVELRGEICGSCGDDLIADAQADKYGAIEARNAGGAS